MIYKLMPLILLCLIICLSIYLDKKSWFGLFLNKRVKIYYQRLKQHLVNIAGSQIADEIIKSGINNLKTLYSLYAKPPVNDLYSLSKDIFDNYNNYNITNAWAIFYINNYINNSSNTMINKNCLKKELENLQKNNYNGIPETFLYHFNIKKEQG